MNIGPPDTQLADLLEQPGCGEKAQKLHSAHVGVQLSL